MSATAAEQLSWEEDFFDALATHGMVTRAIRAAGRTTGAVYGRKRTCPEFAHRLEQAQRAFHDRAEDQPIDKTRRQPPKLQWKATFLAALAETSCVSRSAARANVAPNEVYAARRKDEQFARDWRGALAEGYENLELEMLARLRNGEPKDGPKFDNGAALRLLALHHDTMKQEHAQRRNLDVISARKLIEQKLEDLRQRVLARRAAAGDSVQ